MPLSPRFLVCACFFSLGASFGGALGAQEIPGGENEAPTTLVNPRGRVGAARALQLVDPDGRPLAGIFSDPAWETRGGGLFFTRAFGGTRNIWRAFPDPRDASRYPRWLALPVTQFVAPLQAFGARPIEGQRTLLMVSNAANPRLPAQVTSFDLLKKAVRALTNEPDGVSQVAPAPDGKSFAFSAFTRRASSRWQRGGLFPSVSIQDFGDRPTPATLVLLNVWRPAWQNRLLLVESVLNREISRVIASNGTGSEVGTIKIAEGSSISSSRDGSTLVLVGKAATEAPLYLLSGDGSGLTALSSTEGAQSPALSGDGRWLAFTAPLERQPGSQSGSQNERGLWILPLQNAPAPEASPPTPILAPTGVVPALEPLPVAPFSVDPPPVAPISRPFAVKTRVAAPIAQIRAVQNAPRGGIAIWGVAGGTGASATLEIGQGALPKRWEAREIVLPVTPDAPLLVWNPPATARGVWNFRLTVSGPGGAAQSLFTAELPLAPSIPSPATPFGSMPAGGPLPSAPLPDLPAPPPSFPPPLPPLSPAPPVREAPFRALPGFPIQPAPPRPDLSRPDPSRPSPTPAAPNFGPSGSRDAASFNVSNTLAQMKAGQSVTVTFWALNKGTRPWETEIAPDGIVRLVTRWIRFDNGNRNGWTYQTMKNSVAPGARTRWDFQLVAPRQPGRYKLIYALQRVPQGWAPPAYNAAQETWPSDFEAIAFAVVVKP